MPIISRAKADRLPERLDPAQDNTDKPTKADRDGLLKKVTRRPRPKSEAALLPPLPANAGEDLINLRDAAGDTSFSSRYLTAEELSALQHAARGGTALTVEEKIAILEMSMANLGPTIIASRIGRSYGVVTKFLSRYRNRGVLARAYLETNSERLAKRVVKSATVEESLEVLDRLDVLPEKVRDKEGGAQQFNIIVGMPGQSKSIPIPDQSVVEAIRVEAADAPAAAPEAPADDTTSTSPD